MARTFTLTLTGGQRAKRFLRNTAQRLGSGATLNVGFLSAARYPNGLHVAQNAFWQEFGTRLQPPRPFMRRTIDQHSGDWAKAFAKIARDQHYDAVKTLTLMGEGIKGQIVRGIVDLTSPPLADSTVKAKGFDKPLIDSALMMRSVDYEVVTK